MKIGCVLMAAGSGSRFGCNKLAAMYKGRPLYAHALSVIPDDEFFEVAVVTQYDEIKLMAERMGFTVIINRAPEDGISRTIGLGLSELIKNGADAAMFLVCDQPRLTKSSVKRVLARFREHPDRIVALGHEARRGNPAVFPSAYFDKLLSLESDAGGSEIIRRHPDALKLCQAEDEAELFDVDSALELDRLKTI